MFFVVKSLVVTAVIVMLLQFEVGGHTLESRAEKWLVSSEVSSQLRQVAGGAIKISQDLWKKGLLWAGLDSKSGQAKKEWTVEYRHKSSKKKEDEE